MDKKDIIEVLEPHWDDDGNQGENPFKIRAYSAGARTLQTMEEDLGDVIEEGRLGAIFPGILVRHSLKRLRPFMPRENLNFMINWWHPSLPD